MRREREKSEFQERVLQINRVTRVVKGGKRLRFRTLVIIGDKKGRVAYGLGKAADVSESIAKAVRSAKKGIRSISLTAEGSLPYAVKSSYKKAAVLLKPAPLGTGIVAGGAVRVVLELAGVKNVMAKALGTADKLNNTVATVNALLSVRSPERIRQLRGLDRDETR